MSRQVHLNAFTQNASSSQSFGQWKHPDDKLARGYRDIDFWVHLAKVCERGRFDGLFLADSHAAKDVYGGDYEAAVRAGAQFPANDPSVLPALLARETDHLGFIVTWSTGYFPPFHTARMFSTLDHFTAGRIGWNVVTSYSKSALRNGMGSDVPHDERYDRADEYMEVVHKLWERSWEEDAVVLDAASNTYADPAKVHRIDHKGTYYEVEGPHACEPSPQRTPFIVQAGSSSRGNAFAGRFAEAVFLIATNIAGCARSVAALRAAAAAEGRDPASVKAMLGLTCIVADTEAEARAKYDDYLGTADVEAGLVTLSGSTGIDLSAIDRSASLSGLTSSGIKSFEAMFRGIDGSGDWSITELADFLRVSHVMPVLVGNPQQVADELERWMDEADLDGFNLAPVRAPGDIEDFVDLVVPELQARGRFRREYTGSTLREHYSDGPRLATDYPARRL